MATKKSPVKKKAKPAAQTPSQDQTQKAEMQEFQMWLQKKYNIQDENQLQMKAQELGEDGIKQEYMLFQQEKEQGQMQIMRKGGMIQHITKLLAFKQGGKPTEVKPPVKKLKMKGVSTGTADIETIPTKNIDVKPKSLIKKKK